MKQSMLLLALVVGGFAATESHAQLAVSGSVETVSHYVWRGYAVVDGPTVQPSVDIAWEGTGLSLNIWGSAALIDRTAYHGTDEFDLTLNYAVPVGQGVDLNAGVIFYTFPNQDAFSFEDHTTPEFYVQAAPASWPLSPSLFVAYDANLGGDWYAALGVEQGFSVAAQAFSVGVTGGYNNGQFAAASGFSHLDISLSTALTMGPVTLAPRAVFVHSFENTGNEGNRLFFGVGFGL